MVHQSFIAEIYHEGSEENVHSSSDGYWDDLILSIVPVELQLSKNTHQELIHELIIDSKSLEVS